MIKNSFLLFFILLLFSCAEPLKEPCFVADKSQTGHQSNAYAKQKSNELAKDGWHVLMRYINGSPKYIYDFIHAQDYFNYSWTWDHENYNVYWGWGIIRGIQATMTDDPHLVKKYLLQSIEFLSEVPKYNCPVTEFDNLNLDLVNAYNAMGEFYRKTNHPEESISILLKGQKLLENMEKTNLKNGRLYYLLAVNQFYQSKFKNAQRYVEKAQNLNYPIPDDFIMDLAKSQ